MPSNDGWLPAEAREAVRLRIILMLSLRCFLILARRSLTCSIDGGDSSFLSRSTAVAKSSSLAKSAVISTAVRDLDFCVEDL